jgi:carbon storage regulator
MLVLTRDVDQKILIGENIVITVVEIRRRDGKVRLGIEAPKEVAIDRPDAKHHEPKTWQP